MTEAERQETKSRITTTTDLKSFNDVDIVIEAATEDVELKEKIFRELTNATAPNTILATNTSSISITRIGSVTNRPDKVIGMHFVCCEKCCIDRYSDESCSCYDTSGNHSKIGNFTGDSCSHIGIG